MYVCVYIYILYVYYIVFNRSYIQNIGPDFCVRRCDIARACKGYIRSEDTKVKSIFRLI